MTLQIDIERLIIFAVVIGALVLWAGIIAESVGLHPRAKVLAASVFAILIPLITVIILVYSYLAESDSVR